MPRKKDIVTVFFADDHAIVRESLAAVVSSDPAIRVVGNCEGGLEVEGRVAELDPDILVLDITMPGLNGLDICRRLMKTAPRTAVIILTMHSDEALIARAVKNGARGYLLKEAAAEQLIEAIHAVAHGGTYLQRALSVGVMQKITDANHDSYEQLTHRERQILQMVAEGMTGRSIAKKLNLAFKTVDTHRTNLMRKLDIHDQTSLVKYALQRGIIGLE